eukprot:TRINITY_DN123_c0_g3_i1.p1 TRINITY_DN123_c0_g3~~TRINITY_DN123_c0_g3_i1.p1  ORF type:complete len:911 (+),score=194.20 TRINITY_DN123_c0_g3_i1:54-2786(+)
MRGVFLSIIAFLTSCFIFTKCADEEISDKIIPVVAHFDKQYYFNYQYEKAIELGLLYANSLKILEEYSLQIIFETDELEEVFSRFITDKKPPVAIIGLGTTQRHVEVNEINEVFEKVPVVGLSTASLAASKNSYRLTVPEDRISNAIGSLIKAADWHRVAIVHESGSFGVSITNDLASILEDSGREYFVYPCIDEEDSTFETIYQGIFDRGATVLILKGYTNFMKNFLVYGIKKSYIGINSDESLLIVIHSDASCDALLLKIDAAAVLLAHHLSGHLCVENVSDIRGNFESDYWDPYVGQNDLTNAERDGSGMSHWKGDNMDAFVPFAYDSVLWLSYAIRQICELNSETEMSGCYEKLSDTSEGNIFAKTLSTFSIHGFTGTASTEPYHRTVVNYYGKEYNREDETSTVKWIPIANHLGGINDTIAQSSLDTIVWPDGTNNVHKDMFLVETSFEVKMIYTVSGLIAVSAATVLVRSLRTKKRGFSFGLYGKLDTAGVILVAIVTLFSASFFLGAETTSGKCVVMFGAEFLPFLMLLMISLGLIRFHDVLLNKSLSRVSYIGTNYKLKWVTIFLVGWIIWIIFRIVVFGGIDDVLRLHDPDWNTYWSVCKWNGGLYLEEENGAYILGISKLLLFVGFFALCYALCYRLTHFGKQSLKKSRRYMIFVFLRRMFATGLMMYVLASAILLTVPYSSLSTKPEHCEQSNSHSEHEDMNGFDDCKLKISSNAVLWFKSFSGTSRIFTTLVCVTTVAAELIYIHQMKRRQLRKRKRKIFDRDEDLAQTSTKIDKRFDLQAEIVPKRAFDFLSRRKKGGMFGKSLKYSATGGTVMDIINNKNNGVDQTLIVNQIIKGNLPVISEGDSQIDTNHDNSRKTESKVRDISFMRNSDLITNNQSIFNTQDADVILATVSLFV